MNNLWNVRNKCLSLSHKLLVTEEIDSGRDKFSFDHLKFKKIFHVY